MVLSLYKRIPTVKLVVYINIRKNQKVKINYIRDKDQLSCERKNKSFKNIQI